MGAVAESWASSEATRASMLGNRSRDTSPELALRRLLHAKGLRYRVHARPLADLRRTADIVFRPARVAVFVDGCFWHRCPEHGTSPKSNSTYWSPKLDRNVERDRETDEVLRSSGWLVIRAWEHEDPSTVATRVARAVRRRRGRGVA
jgi:DNA mismatch endonuclease (patch repair protein)